MAGIDRFLQTRLYSQSGLANGVALTGKAGSAVVLGEYFEGVSSLRKSVRADWSFNEQQRLQDVYIRRVNLEK